MSDVTIPVLQEAAVEGLRAGLRGELVQPGDETYDEARKIYNGMIDRRPRLIARCADAADVIVAVNFARENDVPLAVRGGGHHGAGLSLVDDGLVVDLSSMKSVHVDPAARTVRVEGGATSGDVDHATHAFGLAVPFGLHSNTGIAGLTLGGGSGYLTRKHGLTLDNLLGADVVLADGSFVTVSDADHPDLFWALRGGGGNFGVVTSFVFRAHPVSTVYAGPIFWDASHAKAVMQAYRDYLPEAPEELGILLGLKTVPSMDPFPREGWGKRACAIIGAYNGPASDAEKALAPLLEALPAPIFNWMGEMPFPAMQSLFDPLLPPGLQWYWKGDFVASLPDEAIDAHIAQAARAPSELSFMHLHPIDGAAQRVGKNDTAFNYREAKWSMVIAGIDADAANKEAISAWAKEYWKALHPYSAGGGYVNFMMEEGQDRVRASYRDNYERLAEIKHKYDPSNLFRMNQNIKPGR